ncbi:MAG: hypothetical protein Q8M15_08805 [Bacteroidota bacterium]|nr:hypothetical protein [Bacteroidota bacterium]
MSKISGKIVAFRFGKHAVGIQLDNGTMVPVSEVLLASMSRGAGTNLVLNGQGAQLTCNKRTCVAGSPVMNNGKVVADANGVQQLYTKTHDRYEDINIVLDVQARIAANIGEAFAKSLMPSAVSVAKVSDPLAEETVVDAPVATTPANSIENTVFEFDRSVTN